MRFYGSCFNKFCTLWCLNGMSWTLRACCAPWGIHRICPRASHLHTGCKTPEQSRWITIWFVSRVTIRTSVTDVLRHLCHPHNMLACSPPFSSFCAFCFSFYFFLSSFFLLLNVVTPIWSPFVNFPNIQRRRSRVPRPHRIWGSSRSSSWTPRETSHTAEAAGNCGEQNAQASFNTLSW